MGTGVGVGAGVAVGLDVGDGDGDGEADGEGEPAAIVAKGDGLTDGATVGVVADGPEHVIARVSIAASPRPHGLILVTLVNGERAGRGCPVSKRSRMLTRGPSREPVGLDRSADVLEIDDLDVAEVKRAIHGPGRRSSVQIGGAPTKGRWLPVTLNPRRP